MYASWPGSFMYEDQVAIIGAVIAVIIVALAIWIGFKIARRKKQKSISISPLRKEHRISVCDKLPIDDKHSLLLVRRDNIEHLLLIGGESELVIESYDPIISKEYGRNIRQYKNNLLREGANQGELQHLDNQAGSKAPQESHAPLNSTNGLSNSIQNNANSKVHAASLKAQPNEQTTQQSIKSPKQVHPNLEKEEITSNAQKNGVKNNISAPDLKNSDNKDGSFTNHPKKSAGLKPLNNTLNKAAQNTTASNTTNNQQKANPIYPSITSGIGWQNNRADKHPVQPSKTDVQRKSGTPLQSDRSMNTGEEKNSNKSKLVYPQMGLNSAPAKPQNISNKSAYNDEETIHREAMTALAESTNNTENRLGNQPKPHNSTTQNASSSSITQSSKEAKSATPNEKPRNGFNEIRKAMQAASRSFSHNEETKHDTKAPLQDKVQEPKLNSSFFAATNEAQRNAAALTQNRPDDYQVKENTRNSENQTNTLKKEHAIPQKKEENYLPYMGYDFTNAKPVSSFKSASPLKSEKAVDNINKNNAQDNALNTTTRAKTIENYTPQTPFATNNSIKSDETPNKNNNNQQNLTQSNFGHQRQSQLQQANLSEDKKVYQAFNLTSRNSSKYYGNIRPAEESDFDKILQDELLRASDNTVYPANKK